jgi:REP element-mobilizing transposase RayT
MRRRFYPFEEKPFHLTHRGTYFDVGIVERRILWGEVTDLLQDLGKRRILTIHAFVLMSNHFHFLWSPMESSQAAAFCEFSSEISKILNCDSPTWDKSIFPIESFYQYHQVYKYIYRNPVEAGLVYRVEDYRFSTLQHVLGNQKLLIGLQDPFGLIFNQFRMLEWLNTPTYLSERRI